MPHPRALLPAVLLLGVAPTLAPGQEPLTTARAIRELSPVQAAEKKPVRLEGVVTHASPHVGDFFMQDETSPIYVHPCGQMELTAGDTVVVEGVTDAGGFAPCVRALSVKEVGRGTLPDPLPYDLNLDDSRWLDSQYVQCWAIIRKVGTVGGYTGMEIQARRGTAIVAIPGEEHVRQFQKLLDASIKVRGVCVPHFNERRLVSAPPRLFVQEPGQVEVLPRMKIELDKAPATLLENLYRFSPDPHPLARRVKVAGVVLGNGPSQVYYMQDNSTQAVVAPVNFAPLTPGTLIEAIGMLEVHGSSLRIDPAEVRVVGHGPAPTPQKLTASEAFAGNFNFALVSMTGRVVDIQKRLKGQALVLQDGATVFECHVPVDVDLSDLAAESRVQAAGILRRAEPAKGGAANFNILLRDAADLVVLEQPPPPPWWTTPRVASALAAAAIMGLVAFMWVVTLRVRVRRQTEQLRSFFEKEALLQKQLRQAQNLEAIGRVAGGVAHDFNNLLTVISGCSELLRNELPPHSRLAELTDDIIHAGDKAAALTNQLLLVSRHHPVPLGPMDLNAAITETCELLRRIVGEHIQIHCASPGPLPAIRAERGLIHQLLLNLAVNARDAMPDGGVLTIAAAALPNGRVRLSVGDTGHGMDAATQARIFEPFFTTKDLGKGTGLGLTTVQSIARTLEAEIRFRSTVGQGTTFEIDFPAAPAVLGPAVQAAGTPALAADRPSVPPTSRLIMIVEDEAPVRGLITHMLASAGFRLLTASGPLEALEIAAQHQGEIDLLLTDVIMPEMNGRVLAEKLWATRPSLRVLFMSGYSADEVLEKGVRTDDMAFLQKPFRADALVAKVRATLAASR